MLAAGAGRQVRWRETEEVEAGRELIDAWDGVVVCCGEVRRWAEKEEEGVGARGPEIVVWVRMD